jgi:hypothetical protein
MTKPTWLEITSLKVTGQAISGTRLDKVSGKNMLFNDSFLPCSDLACVMHYIPDSTLHFLKELRFRCFLTIDWWVFKWVLLYVWCCLIVALTFSFSPFYVTSCMEWEGDSRKIVTGIIFL